MKGFIHTFGVTKKISEEQFTKLKTGYANAGFFYEGDKKHWVIGCYSDKGVRLEISFCSNKERKYDKERPKKVLMVFTVYKMLHNGKKMGAIRETEDLVQAYKNMITILKEIYEKSGVDLWENAKISRVDVTYDIITPSEMYSKEIIRLAKKVILKKGFNFWIPEKDEGYNEQWGTENATFIYNHSQEIEAKLYDKRNDKDADDELKMELGEKGLVRFEVSLKRNYLKENGYVEGKYIDPQTIPLLLINIMKDSEEILGKYFADVLDTGAMMSKKVLQSYISNVCGSKDKRREKMLDYVEWVNAEKRSERYEGSDSATKLFKKWGLSPVYSRKECPYIPSFRKLLELEECDESKWLCWARYYNKEHRHQYLYWEDGDI